MKIIKYTFEMGNDFSARIECEHCGRSQMLKSGYHDAHYHNRVLPAITCASCGKNRAGEVPEVKNDNGAVHVPAAEAPSAPRVCECSLAIRLTGDGCEVCNPELAARLKREAEEDDDER